MQTLVWLLLLFLNLNLNCFKIVAGGVDVLMRAVDNLIVSFLQ
jgi:hypothetical protein